VVGPNVVGRDKFASLLIIVDWRFRAGIEHLFARTNPLGRITMAVEAPLHCQRRGLPRQFHLLDRPMACRAGDAFGEPTKALASADRHPGNRGLCSDRLRGELGGH